MTREEKLEYQREKRKLNENAYTKKYERTHGGKLMRIYRNMKSRVEGVQREKAHLYSGLELIGKHQFYEWAVESPEFWTLFDAWRDSGFSRKLAPSVDRIDSSRGYVIGNMEWVTHSENSRRGAISKGLKK